MGIMKASYVGTEDDRTEVEAYLQRNVKQVIETAPDTMSRVEVAYYVGSRFLPSPPPPPVSAAPPASDTTKEADVSGSSFVGLASGLAAGAVVAMLLLYCAVARRRRRRNNEEDPTAAAQKEPQEVADNEVDLQAMQPTMTVSKSVDTRSGEEDADVEAASTGDGHVGVPAPSIVLMAGRTGSTAAMGDSGSDGGSQPDPGEDEIKRVVPDTPKEDEFKNVSVTSSNERGKGPTVMVDTNKPPKPPTAPKGKKPPVVPVPVPKPLKQRRKRKKKKKPPSMKRTNSRENIVNMETIAEGENEGSGGSNDGSDEEGSEYSWYSTDDSDPGSRDPSPARSSREPSPVRSTSSREASPARSAASSSEGETENLSHRRMWV